MFAAEAEHLASPDAQRPRPGAGLAIAWQWDQPALRKPKWTEVIPFKTPMGSSAEQVSRLIKRMWRENPLWGEDRISGELAKLFFKVSPGTVARYRPRSRRSEHSQPS